MEHKPHRILVVDDSHDVADALADVLREEGYEARTAYTAQDALTIASSYAPDVAILDFVLPDMNGCALAAELRRRHGTELRLVAFTGHSSAATSRSDFDAVMIKPAGVADILAAVDR